MSWMVIIALPVMYDRMTQTHLLWLMTGGTFYTVGALVYGLKQVALWPNVFGSYEICHLFVLTGAGCHLRLTCALLPTPCPRLLTTPVVPGPAQRCLPKTRPYSIITPWRATRTPKAHDWEHSRA